MRRRRRINFGDSWNLVDQAPDTPGGGSSFLAKLAVAIWYSIVGMPTEEPTPRRRAMGIKKAKTRTRTAAERSKAKRRKRRLRRG